MDKAFGGEGDENLLTLSLGGARPYGGSFPSKRDVDRGGIVLGPHEHGGDGVVGKDKMREWRLVQ